MGCGESTFSSTSCPPPHHHPAPKPNFQISLHSSFFKLAKIEPDAIQVGAEGASPPARLESVDAGLAKLAEMRDCVDSIAQDGAKFFDKGNKAAGVRARKALQDLKTLAQELRVAIQRCKSESAQARLVEQDQS